MVTNTEDLKQTVQEIESSLKQAGFSIFYGFEFPETRHLAEFQWDAENHELNGFLEVAKEAGVRVMVLEVHRFEEQDLERFLPEVEEEAAPHEGLKDLRKYVGNVFQFSIAWCKDSVKYNYTKSTDWWDELTEQETQRELGTEEATKTILDDIRKRSSEQLTDELLAFIEKELPESEISVGFPYEAEQLFWESKGLKRLLVEDPQVRIKMKRVEILARSRLEQRLQEKERELISELVEQCVKWAKDNGLKKVTKTNVDFFLTEAGRSLSRTSRDVIYNRVNLLLSRSDW